MYLMRQEDSPWGEGSKVPVPLLWSRHHLALRALPSLRQGVQLPRMRIQGTMR